MTQQPPQNTGPTVEIEIDMLARLVEIMGSGRFPDTAARDLVQPLIYCSRVVVEAKKKLQLQQAQASYGPPGGIDTTPAPAPGPPGGVDIIPESPNPGPPSNVDIIPEP